MNPQSKAAQYVSDLESLLQVTLKPVVPKQEFINGLRSQLADQLQDLPARRKSNRDAIILVTAAGILSGLMIIMVGIRIVLMLISTLGLISQYRQTQKRNGSNIQPAG